MDESGEGPYHRAMTRDQYSELVAFLGRKFDAIDNEFEETRRHATVLFEQSRAELRTFAEGTNARFEKVDARFREVDERFREVDERLGSLDRRMSSLDDSVRGALTDHEARIRALEP